MYSPNPPVASYYPQPCPKPMSNHPSLSVIYLRNSTTTTSPESYTKATFTTGVNCLTYIYQLT